jgi:hypothetical protein
MVATEPLLGLVGPDVKRLKQYTFLYTLRNRAQAVAMQNAAELTIQLLSCIDQGEGPAALDEAADEIVTGVCAVPVHTFGKARLVQLLADLCDVHEID